MTPNSAASGKTLAAKRKTKKALSERLEWYFGWIHKTMYSPLSEIEYVRELRELESRLEKSEGEMLADIREKVEALPVFIGVNPSGFVSKSDVLAILQSQTTETKAE